MQAEPHDVKGGKTRPYVPACLRPRTTRRDAACCDSRLRGGRSRSAVGRCSTGRCTWNRRTWKQSAVRLWRDMRARQCSAGGKSRDSVETQARPTTAAARRQTRVGAAGQPVGNALAERRSAGLDRAVPFRAYACGPLLVTPTAFVAPSVCRHLLQLGRAHR
eukprot:56164-Chlamydomonas_euryale.AAC.4